VKRRPGRRSLVMGVVVVLTGMLVLGAMAAAGSSGSAARSFVVYAKPSTVEFMNHADDRVRGMTTNPFAANAQALVLLTKGAEKGNGPFPGDDVLYTFKLYRDSGGSRSEGTATFTCYYTFGKRATCEAYFRLAGGLLLASGQIRFDSSGFELSASGGTEAYLGERGAITGLKGGSSAGVQKLRVDLVSPAGSGLAAGPGRSLAIYSSATAVQYLNNADDEARGLTNNPFSSGVNKLRPKLEWKGNGPFAGDVVIYSFNLFNDRSLKKKAGSATYTCYFNYKKMAFCNTYYSLKSGASTIVASGPIDFNTTGFSLPITGGTSRYVAARGELKETSVKTANAQRLEFRLLG
jgi:hypothetical protein